MSSEAHTRDAAPGAAYDLTVGVERTGPALAPPAQSSGRYSSGSLIAGKYHLSQILGEGGMGSVWVARNRTLDLEVALKLMRPELAEDVDGVAERMLQEARAAASIGHPAIIQVFDFGFAEHGDPFIVMELLRGESLSQAIRRRGKVNPMRAAQTLLPIVDALSAAHRRGIVHRDLKPENIFLARPAGQRLQPKVLDFGIAKLEQRAQERLTRDGAVIGSPAYMAPEQLRGEPGVDARADVWSLGVVFYETITGRRPFEGANYHASMWNIINAEPHSIAEHGVADPELARILQQCLMKDPKQRCPDMRSFGRALASWLISQGVHEDVCNASLSAWLEDGPASGTAAYSFFPSETPGTAAAQAGPSATSGTRRIELDPTTQVQRQAPRRAAPLGRHALLVLAAALVAFIGAATFAGGSDEEPEPEPVVDETPARKPAVAAAPVLVAPVDAREGVLSPIATALTEAPEARERSDRVTARRGAGGTRSTAGSRKKRSELKDPFD